MHVRIAALEAIGIIDGDQATRETLLSRTPTAMSPSWRRPRCGGSARSRTSAPMTTLRSRHPGASPALAGSAAVEGLSRPGALTSACASSPGPPAPEPRWRWHTSRSRRWHGLAPRRDCRLITRLTPWLSSPPSRTRPPAGNRSALGAARHPHSARHQRAPPRSARGAPRPDRRARPHEASGRVRRSSRRARGTRTPLVREEAW